MSELSELSELICGDLREANTMRDVGASGHHEGGANDNDNSGYDGVLCTPAARFRTGRQCRLALGVH